MQPWYRHPTARRYIVSYLLISVLPILGLGFLFCYRQGRNAQASQQQWAADCTRQISDAFEANLQAVETAAIHFSTNYGGVLDDPSADVLVPLQLATYKQAYALPGDLLLYPRGTNAIYTPDARMSYLQFHGISPYRSELDRVSFFTRINTISSSLYISSYGFQGESNYFLFLNPIPYLDAAPSATMIYVIGLDGFNGMITDYLGAFTGYFCVLDAAGRISYILNRYDGHSADSIRLAVSALRGTPTVEHAIDAERFVTTRILSGARHFTYLLSIPRAALSRALWQALWIYGAGTLLLALFAGAVSVWLARRQFMPITRLEQALSEEDAAQREAQEDIFEAIRRRYDSMQSKNEQLVLQLQSHAALARGKLFDDLLAGRIRDDEQLAHALQLGNIRFDAGGFFVIVAQLMGAQGRSGMASEAAPFFGEILFCFGKAYGAETGDGNRLAFVVNTGRSQEPAEEVLLKTAVLFQDELTELGFRVAGVGVSGMHSSALRLNLSLFEALAAMEGGGEGIHRFVKREEDQNAPYRFAICELYRQGLQYGSADMALTTLNKMAENLRGRNLPLAQQQAFCFMLVNLLLDFCEKNNLSLDAVDLTLAASQADLDAFLVLAEASMRRLCGRVEAERERQRAATHREIIEYIHEHVSQQSLTVDSVADAFHLSGSYVRKLIKGQWYAKGYISKDFMTANPTTLFQTEKAACVVANGYEMFPACKELGVPITCGRYARHAEDDLIHTLRKYWHNNGGTTYVSGKADEKTVATALRVIDYGYTEEGILLWNFGPKGVTWDEADENGYPLYNDFMLNNPNYPIVNAEAILKPHGGWSRFRFGDGICMATNQKDPDNWAYRARWGEDETVTTDYGIPPFTLSAEDDETIAQIMNNVDTHAKEMTLKYITGAADFANFDAEYTKVLQSFGIDEAIAIKQAGYDAYLAK